MIQFRGLKRPWQIKERNFDLVCVLLQRPCSERTLSPSPPPITSLPAEKLASAPPQTNHTPIDNLTIEKYSNPVRVGYQKRQQPSEDGLLLSSPTSEVTGCVFANFSLLNVMEKGRQGTNYYYYLFPSSVVVWLCAFGAL